MDTTFSPEDSDHHEQNPHHVCAHFVCLPSYFVRYKSADAPVKTSALRVGVANGRWAAWHYAVYYLTVRVRAAEAAFPARVG
jgi:hypothetical protein